jgi:hypothetical protein
MFFSTYEINCLWTVTCMLLLPIFGNENNGSINGKIADETLQQGNHFKKGHVSDAEYDVNKGHILNWLDFPLDKNITSRFHFLSNVVKRSPARIVYSTQNDPSKTGYQAPVIYASTYSPTVPSYTSSVYAPAPTTVTYKPMDPATTYYTSSYGGPKYPTTEQTEEYLTQPPAVYTSQPPAVYTTEPPEVYTTEPPEVYTTEPPEVYTTQPPAVYTSQPPAVYTTQPPAVYTTQPPAVYTTEPPEVYTTEPPEVYTTQPPAVYTTEPPAVYTTEPPAVYTTQPPPVYTTQPPAVYTTDPPAVYTTQPPAVYTTEPPAVYTTDPPAVYTTQPPAVYTTQPPAVYTTEPPAVYTTEPPAVYTTEPPAVYTTDPPAVYTTQPPPVYTTQPPAVYTTEPPTVYTTEPPAVYTTEPPAVYTTQPPAVYTTEPPAVYTTEPPAVYTTEPPAVYTTAAYPTAAYPTTAPPIQVATTAASYVKPIIPYSPMYPTIPSYPRKGYPSSYVNTYRADRDNYLSKRFCPANWKFFRGSCYYPVKDEKLTWTSSESKCQEIYKGAHLVSIRSYEENTYAKQIMGNDFPAFWIALTDLRAEYRFQWTNPLVSLEYLNWQQGRPQNAISQNCGRMQSGYSAYWQDVECNYQHEYLCHIILPEFKEKKKQCTCIRKQTSNKNSPGDRKNVYYPCACKE